jgi:hypothetical protein
MRVKIDLCVNKNIYELLREFMRFWTELCAIAGIYAFLIVMSAKKE